jgi:hypothetical protein
LKLNVRRWKTLNERILIRIPLYLVLNVTAIYFYDPFAWLKFISLDYKTITTITAPSWNSIYMEAMLAPLH